MRPVAHLKPLHVHATHFPERRVSIVYKLLLLG